MKSLLIAALVVSLQAALNASPASSPEALADAYIISLTADGVLPVDLLHGPCMDTLSKEQQEFFDSLASTTLFSPDEFRYEISDTISPRSNRINYCVPPEKEIVIYNKKWRSTIPWLRIDIFCDRGDWRIIVPTIENDLFSEIKHSHEKQLVECKRLLSLLTEEKRSDWRTRFHSDDKYAVIEEVLSHFNIDDNLALLLLVEIMKEQ